MQRHALPDLGRVRRFVEKAVELAGRHGLAEPVAGHDAVAAANAYAGLGQVQLETADVFKGGRLGGPLEKCSEPLATDNGVCVRSELALIGNS